MDPTQQTATYVLDHSMQLFIRGMYTRIARSRKKIKILKYFT